MNHWSDYTQAESQLARLLNALAALFAGLALALLILPYLLPAAPLFIAPPFFVSNSMAGLTLLAFLAWFSAGDVRRFRPMIDVLIAALLIGAAAFLVMYLRPVDPMQEAPLLLGFGVCCVIALLITAQRLRARNPQAPWLPWIPDKPLTQPETIARVFFAIFGVAALSGAAGSLLLPYMGETLIADVAVNPFMIAGSAVKIATIGLCALLIAFDVRRFVHHTQLLTALIIGNGAFLYIMLMAVPGFDRFGDYMLSIGGMTFTREQMMFGAWLLDVVVIAVLLFINNQINRSLLDYIGFFSASQFRGLEAIAETLVAGEGGEIVPPHEIVLRTDSYLKSFHSNRLRLARMAVMGLQLAPLAWLRPPINYLHPAARQAFVDRRFKAELIDPIPPYRLVDGLLRLVNRVMLRVQNRPAEDLDAALSFIGLLEAMMRFNMQLVYIGYYNNPDVWNRSDDGKGIGYVPFSQRTKDFDVTPRRPHPPLDVITPETLERQGVDVINDADVVIIGSGAAGAILAEQLLAKGRRVLMLEKGKYVHPDDFTEDEVDMISQLYSDGALQLSQALRFTILQGSCVGGTTVVNNAVCFDTPQQVLDTWNSRGATPVLDAARFHASQQAVRQRMRIQPIAAGTRQPLDGGVLNHGDSVVTAAVHHYFQNQTAYEYDVVQANIVDCLGCGYCNIGCKYGRKLSMLDEVLPAAQHKYGADHFRIIAEAEVVKLDENSGKINRVVAKVGGQRQLVINNPHTVILSAGTIASSWLMMQSGIGKKHNLPVGRGLSFNMGSPLHALFDQELNSFDGLQIAHYLKVKDQPGFVYETWYNPPVAQALAMPGWLDTHFQNMSNYSRITGVGVLVGTDPTAYIVPAVVTGGPDVVFQPTANDMKKLVDALVLLGDILLSGGAREVYASTRRYQTYRNQTAVFSAQSQLDGLRELVQHDYDILLGTGHPQGGNALGVSAQNSVVGPDFKVFGYDNLYLCDASAFPTSTTVNPQLTVMSLAHYAAQII